MSPAALLAYCDDDAELKKRALVQHAAALPTDQARREFFDGLAKHHSSDLVRELRRRTWALMLGGGDLPQAPLPQVPTVQESLL